MAHMQMALRAQLNISNSHQSVTSLAIYIPHGSPGLDLEWSRSLVPSDARFCAGRGWLYLRIKDCWKEEYDGGFVSCLCRVKLRDVGGMDGRVRFSIDWESMAST